MSLERVIIYLEAYAYDVCAWHRQVIALWVANEAISAVDENSSFLELPRAIHSYIHDIHCHTIYLSYLMIEFATISARTAK